MKENPIGSVRLAALLAGALFLGAALAQSSGYPARTIRLVAGTAPGGITDYLARVSAEGLAALLGTQPCRSILSTTACRFSTSRARRSC